MAMTIADRQRLMTPSGRPPVMTGEPRPYGPKCDLVPLWPPWPPPPWKGEYGQPAASSSNPVARAPAISPRQNVNPTSELMTVAVPKLDSPIALSNGQLSIPWQQLIVSLWRLAQPTGITPGTFAGITFNAFGQAVAATNTGVSFNNVSLTGTSTSTTPPANDNSNAIATTAWVREQGYATENFVTSQGFATESFVTSRGFVTESFVTSQGFATQAWVQSQGYLTDAPGSIANDGNRYGRQNGQWVVIP